MFCNSNNNLLLLDSVLTDKLALRARAKLRGRKIRQLQTAGNNYLLKLQTTGSLYLYLVFPCSFKLFLPHRLQLLPATATVFARCLQLYLQTARPVCSSFKNWFSTALLLTTQDASTCVRKVPCMYLHHHTYEIANHASMHCQ